MRLKRPGRFSAATPGGRRWQNHIWQDVERIASNGISSQEGDPSIRQPRKRNAGDRKEENRKYGKNKKIAYRKNPMADTE
jgi:hypothetical protein